MERSRLQRLRDLERQVDGAGGADLRALSPDFLQGSSSVIDLAGTLPLPRRSTSRAPSPGPTASPLPSPLPSPPSGTRTPGTPTMPWGAPLQNLAAGANAYAPPASRPAVVPLGVGPLGVQWVPGPPQPVVRTAVMQLVRPPAPPLYACAVPIMGGVHA